MRVEKYGRYYNTRQNKSTYNSVESIVQISIVEIDNLLV